MPEEKLAFYKALLDNLYDGVYFVDTDRRIIYWNKGAERITGYTAEEVMGKFCRDNLLSHCNANGEELCLTQCPLTDSIKLGRGNEVEVFLHHADGHRVPVLVRTSPMVEDGAVVGAVEIFSNSSRLLQARQRAQEMETIASKDPLTGAANRRAAEMHLKTMLLEFNRLEQPFGVLFADIDYFKKINDRYGHATGDRVLQMVVKNLSNNLRQDDRICRWGGEEFLIMIWNVDQAKMEQIAKKLLMLTEKAYLNTEQGQIPVTLSIGATLSRKGDTLKKIIRRADALMYESKQNGRNQVTFG